MKELKIQPIKDGTVIDHIAPGNAFKVLKILGIPGSSGESVISIAINVLGKKGRKDIVKIENRELDPREVDRIALVAPNATINIIRDFEVTEKHCVLAPNKIINILKCSNPNCISNTNEPVGSKFIIKRREPLKIVCHYCERELEDIASSIL